MKIENLYDIKLHLQDKVINDLKFYYLNWISAKQWKRYKIMKIYMIPNNISFIKLF